MIPHRPVYYWEQTPRCLWDYVSYK